jgi:hypothetical protein
VRDKKYLSKKDNIILGFWETFRDIIKGLSKTK